MAVRLGGLGLVWYMLILVHVHLVRLCYDCNFCIFVLRCNQQFLFFVNSMVSVDVIQSTRSAGGERTTHGRTQSHELLCAGDSLMMIVLF
jgi:hypothetical protein